MGCPRTVVFSVFFHLANDFLYASQTFLKRLYYYLWVASSILSTHCIFVLRVRRKLYILCLFKRSFKTLEKSWEMNWGWNVCTSICICILKKQKKKITGELASLKNCGYLKKYTKNLKKEIFVSTSESVLWKEFVVDVTFQIVSCTVWNKQVCAMCK